MVEGEEEGAGEEAWSQLGNNVLEIRQILTCNRITVKLTVYGGRSKMVTTFLKNS